MRHVNGNGAAAFAWIARRVDAPAMSVGELDQSRGLVHRLLADRPHANFADDSQSRPGGIERGNILRAAHEFIGGLGVADGPRLERERLLVSDPASVLRLQLLAE